MQSVSPAIVFLMLLVFLDEVAVAIAAGVWGNHAFGLAGAILCPIVVMGLWWAFASPKAPYGSGGVRPAVKVVLFTLASIGLWVAGYEAAAVILAIASVIVNGLAQLPAARAGAAAMTGGSPPG